MTAPVSLLPPQSGWTFPAPSVAGLSDDEQRLLTGLSTKLMVQIPAVLQRWAYYDGLQRLQNLGISIPPQLTGVRTVVDWPRVCVDPLVQRSVIAGFRLPGSTEIDDELAEHWQANDLDGEFRLAILDSLVTGRGYAIVGAPDDDGESPLVTVESPLNMTVTWDPRTKRILNGYQAFEVEGTFRAVLYLPNRSIFMAREDLSGSGWAIENVDEHGFGEPPIIRLANRARTSDREGRSEITAAVMNTTDAACRAMLGMDIAREVYSIPRIAILGAAESDFIGSDGSQKSALDMAMTKVLALERDEEGNVPTLQQLATFDPTVFTKIIDCGAQLMSSYTGFPPSYFGHTATANPASADAIRVAHDAMDRRGDQVQNQATPPARRLAQLIWRFAHKGEALPVEMRRVDVEWIDARTATPAADSDAVTKQVAVGIIPARSDVTLSKLHYTPIQRQRIAQDFAADPVNQMIAELGTDVEAKDIIAAIRLLKATGQPVPSTDATPAPDVPGAVPPTPAQAGR